MTLYQAKARVRSASPPVEGRIACSIASAAARSLPRELSMPRKAATPSTTTCEEKAKTMPPAAASTPSATSQRLRPMRSPQNITPAAPTAVPAIPAPRVEPQLCEIDAGEDADQAVGYGTQEARREDDSAVAEHASARRASPNRARG